ncbi:MAG TPA: prepilin-type N-terminal cleavage/methylation domain-containing protein, partial [Chthonomonadales bacterium]|nr:prepilin-type N-terminal cleavage/methylation domain-containing protein [Chthonomonadales bacterium]
MTAGRPTRRGFTMIELLVVIAIIAVLAAILFPVFNRVREQVRQSTCMSQMHDIGQALHLYYLDNNKYPPSLLDFAQYAGAGNTAQFYTGATGTPTPLDQLKTLQGYYLPLFSSQKYLKDTTQFICPDSENKSTSTFSSAVYPQNTPLAGQPVVFTQLMLHDAGALGAGMPVGQTAYFYTYDSYDIGPQIASTGAAVTPAVYELHYCLDWTGVTGPTDTADCSTHPQGLCSNQLKYPDAPQDQTVVT